MRIRARGLVLALLVAGCASLEGAKLYARGTDALERGDVAAAITDLERAAALVPEASAVQNHLGLAYARADREREAVSAFERALELDCDNAAARHNLAAARRRAAVEDRR
jgi:Flp pilus assembly protein TadD